MQAEGEIGKALALLEEIGAEDVDHPRGTLADHLHGTYAILQRWECPADVCLAGLYHSVYGTDVFKTVTLAPDARNRVVEAIGEVAEHLAFTYCALVRDSLYDNLAAGGPPYRVLDRRDRSPIDVTIEQYAKLMTIDLANRFEQMPHSAASRDRFARDRGRYVAATPLLPPRAVEELRATKVQPVTVAVRRLKRKLRRALGR